MNTTIKLGIAAGIVTGVTAWMAWLGTSASWKYYLTVDECLADAPDLVNQRMRISGRVATGSLNVEPDRTRARFWLCGRDGQLPVTCGGPLPDNLAEDMDVIVEGHLDEAGCLQGDQVLTRCASKYATGSRATVTRLPPPTAEGKRR